MPIYEYKCKDCNNEFELLQLPGRNDQPACPECGSTNLKKLISSIFLPSDVGKPANEEPVSRNNNNNNTSSSNEGDTGSHSSTESENASTGKEKSEEKAV
ncbi:MAG: zinc ribbon domain-containing protein [Clostridiales bacterium]|nr:zinc ribbon domain-containing protein [Clostridiales bacterium]MCF8022863.1 zinc ribbon domain-containing protein [Clostridiales bacterium]